jgi:hypothetical protein
LTRGFLKQVIEMRAHLFQQDAAQPHDVTLRVVPVSLREKNAVLNKAIAVCDDVFDLCCCTAKDNLTFRSSLKCSVAKT